MKKNNILFNQLILTLIDAYEESINELLNCNNHINNLNDKLYEFTMNAQKEKNIKNIKLELIELTEFLRKSQSKNEETLHRIFIQSKLILEQCKAADIIKHEIYQELKNKVIH